MADSKVPLSEIERFLTERHGQPVEKLEQLTGGFWSTAWAYGVGDRALIARFGSLREGFDADRDAMAFTRPDLPVPQVLEIGDAFGESYAISVRHYGRFLESAGPEEAAVVGPTIARLLKALRDVPAAPRANGSTWRGWLLDALVDYPTQATAGWRKALAEDRKLDRLFRACEARITDLVDACPERRDLLHGDLLHANVLMTEDASAITAVFSWKCSQRGDFLFDAAWCTFWGHHFPGIAAANALGHLDATGDDWADAVVRHHCYEVQIAATHLGWLTWVEDRARLRSLAAHAERLLEAGPRHTNEMGSA